MKNKWHQKSAQLQRGGGEAKSKRFVKSRKTQTCLIWAWTVKVNEGCQNLCELVFNTLLINGQSTGTSNPHIMWLTMTDSQTCRVFCARLVFNALVFFLVNFFACVCCVFVGKWSDGRFNQGKQAIHPSWRSWCYEPDRAHMVLAQLEPGQLSTSTCVYIYAHMRSARSPQRLR